MNKIKALAALAMMVACFGLSGCFYVLSSTISSSPAKGTRMTATASDWGILYLAAPQGLTTLANDKLIGSCASGKVSSISTELDLRDFFIAQNYTVSVSGNCQ